MQIKPHEATDLLGSGGCRYIMLRTDIPLQYRHILESEAPYSYPPGQQHGTTDLVPFGSVILWILIKICYGRIFSDHCHTRPPTFSVVLSLVQECLLRTLIPGPHHTKGPLTLLYFSSATIDPRTYATDDCYAIMLARTGLPDPYY